MAPRSTPSPTSPDVPQASGPGKPRRFWLYAPFALLAILALAWSCYWVWSSRTLLQTLDAEASRLRSAGYELSWATRKVDGYPFRLDLTLTETRLRTPGGWVVTSPILEAEAFLHSPAHWISATPQGLTFTRQGRGPIEVTGRVLRASISDLGKSPPRLSLEGQGLDFKPGPGSQPFALASAEQLEFHLRPGPNEQGAIFFKVEGGKAAPGGTFGSWTNGQPISLQLEGLVNHAGLLFRQGWANSIKNWVKAGGHLELRQAGLTAGSFVLGAQPGTLEVDSQGRLAGNLSISVHDAPQALVGLAQQGIIPPQAALAASAVAMARQNQAGTAQISLVFQAGRITLGPVAIAASPQIYQP